MFRISKLTDYAVVVAAELDGRAEPRPATELASATGIPSPTLKKVLKALARAELVTSQRGVSGGYRLARGASDISIAEVIAAIDGPIAVTECADDETDNPCAHEDNCGVRANWKRLNDVLADALASVSLADMITREADIVPLFRSGQEAQLKRRGGGQ